MKTLRSTICLIVLFLAACTSAITPTATAVPPTFTPPTLTPQPSSLSLDALKNSSYQTPTFTKSVKLVSGKSEIGSGADYLLVTLLDQVAVGDLNADGVPDAAVILAENSGGSGIFESLVIMLNQNGTPVQSATSLLGDRIKIIALTIQDGEIHLESLVQGPNDPMSSPSQVLSSVYRFSQGALLLNSLSSQTADGRMRTILITFPTSAVQVSSSVEVKGTMPIAPFENNLSYQITDSAGKSLAKGPFAVQSDGAGGPATFDVSLTLPALPSGATIRLELSELSPANGSPLSLASVDLLVK